MSRAKRALGAALEFFARRPVLSYILGALVVTFVVGMLTGWGPRNASGWPLP